MFIANKKKENSDKQFYGNTLAVWGKRFFVLLGVCFLTQLMFVSITYADVAITEGDSGILHFKYLSLADPVYPEYMDMISFSVEFFSGDSGDAIGSITVINDNLTERWVDIFTEDATFDLLIQTINDGHPYDDGPGVWRIKTTVGGYDSWVDNYFADPMPDQYVTVLDTPEPSTCLLLGISALGIACQNRRKVADVA